MTHTDIAIRPATEADQAKWDHFVDNEASGSFYQLYGWRGINERVLRHPTRFLIAHRNGTICGALPLVFVSSRLFGRILCSMPFLNQGGPCTSDAAAEQALVDHAVRLAVELGADYLELRCAQPHELGLPVS